MSSCASCGKGEDESIGLKKCGACKMVNYGSRDCQKAHRLQHKKECRKRAAELHDEALFKQPPQLEDCPICFLRLPTLDSGRRYQACCGKIICTGCIFAVDEMVGVTKCPFCRTTLPHSDEEMMRRENKRLQVDDAQAIHNRAFYYYDGICGLPRDYTKSLELYHRAGELGNFHSYYNVGIAYFNGKGVARDAKKAIHYYELAAIGGNVHARFNLGCGDAEAGNMERALKHFMIAAESGDNDSLRNIKQLYMNGHATKDDYAKALRSYQSYLDDIKSDDRDKAAAFKDDYKYFDLNTAL